MAVTKEYMRKWRAANRERINFVARIWYRRNHSRSLAIRRKAYRAMRADPVKLERYRKTKRAYYHKTKKLKNKLIAYVGKGTR